MATDWRTFTLNCGTLTFASEMKDHCFSNLHLLPAWLLITPFLTTKFSFHLRQMIPVSHEAISRSSASLDRATKFAVDRNIHACTELLAVLTIIPQLNQLHSLHTSNIIKEHMSTVAVSLLNTAIFCSWLAKVQLDSCNACLFFTSRNMCQMSRFLFKTKI